MHESFLHFAWRWRRFDGRDLVTSDGQTITIIHPGNHNTHAGPDFFNARLRIGDTEWAGNLEIHILASDWLLHRHDTDAAYDNVILHVVWENDAPLLRANGQPLPCLELKGRIPRTVLDMYQQWTDNQAWIPCAAQFHAVPDIVRLSWFDRLLVERLEQKTTEIALQFEATQQHWEATFYRVLARSFGLKVNMEPFEVLARSLPLVILTRHKTNLFQTEALIFGQAGWLETTFEEEYPNRLAKEYRFLRHKYQLEPISVSQWKFLRLRPANFPTVRLAQFAALIHQSVHLFSKIIEATSVGEIEQLFAVEVSPYWLTHYQFDRPGKLRPKLLGRDFIHLLLINTIVPCLFFYGKMRQLPDIQDKALQFLEDLPAESNALMTGWAVLGAHPHNASQSQAMLQLKTRYCDEKRCLECHIGGRLLSGDG
jgi:Protein of unknown function (DUF2851)